MVEGLDQSVNSTGGHLLEIDPINDSSTNISILLESNVGGIINFRIRIYGASN